MSDRHARPGPRTRGHGATPPRLSPALEDKPRRYPYFFFFNDPAPPEISPLPLPAALPLSSATYSTVRSLQSPLRVSSTRTAPAAPVATLGSTCVATQSWIRRAALAGSPSRPTISRAWRSEEHTSELQSPCNLVCRLLLEKK